MLRNSFIVSALTVLSSTIAFINQVVLAMTFGTSTDMDIYLCSISAPLTLTGIFGGVLGYQLVPALQSSAIRNGSNDQLVRTLSLGLGGTTLLLGIIGCLFAKELIPILNTNSALTERMIALRIANVAWLWLPLAVLSCIYTAALHIRSRFISATLCQALPTVGALAGCLIGRHQWGLSALVWGQLLGYCAMFCILKILVGPTQSGHDWVGFRRLIAHLPMAFISLLIFVMYPVADSILGSLVGPSAISYLGYAQRLIVGIASLTVAGATTVLFPQLARQGAEGDGQAVLTSLVAGLRVILLVITPIVCLLGIFSLPMTQFLFQRGAFSSTNSRELAALIPFMLLGIVAASCMTLVFKAFFAKGDVYFAAGISLLGTSIYFLISILLIERWGLKGIGSAYAASWWLVLIISLRKLQTQDVWQYPSPSHVSFMKSLAVATIAVMVIGYTGNLFLPDEETGHLLITRLLIIAVTSGIAFGAYLVILYARSISEVLNVFEKCKSYVIITR